MVTRAGRITDIRIAGFTWVLEWEAWGRVGEIGPYSEVVFSTLSPTSALGGTYFIQHDDETGRWFAYEMGGAGPMIWEKEIAHGVTFPSPLAAMRTVRRECNREIREQIRAEKEMDRFFEEERKRARKYRIRGPEPEAVFTDEMEQWNRDMEAKEWQ